jgi:lycopene beta-cyclase
MEKPVIILGGGLLGTLLAYRLKEALPEVDFKLYEESSALGNHQHCTFRSSDCTGSLKWLKPLIAQSWDSHHIKFPRFEKWVTDAYHLIDSRRLNEVALETLGTNIVKLNNAKNLEMALQEGSFVIDARNICHYKKKGFRKYLVMEVELTEDHHLIAPVIFDAGVESKEQFRSLRYLPLSSRKLLVKDFWISENNQINLHEMRYALNTSLSQMGWKIEKVIREDSGIMEIPLSDAIIPQEGRVINLADFIHDTTGSSIPHATKLIDRMVETSFRFGELKEIVQVFRKENEDDKKFFRFLNRLMVEDKQQVFEAIYQQSYPLVERFSRGELSLIDRSRILFGKSGQQVKQLLGLVLPYPLLPPVHMSKPRSV